MPAQQRISADGPHGGAPVLPAPPQLSSAQRHWHGVIFERHRVEPGSLPQHALAEHCFLLPVGGYAVPYRCTLDGRRISGHMVPDKIQFRAAGTSVATEWDATLDGIFVALSPDALQRGLGDDVPDRRLELMSDLQPRDNPVLLHLTLALDAHLRAGGTRGRLFEQLLINAICANLMQSYGSGAPLPRRPAALSRQTLKRVHDFIEQHLAVQFGLEDIARAACLSPYHLGRAYRQTTGQSLWQHVLHRRATLARDLMVGHPAYSLAHIATLTGFESYSQFIAAFRKAWGVAPSAYRRMLH